MADIDGHDEYDIGWGKHAHETVLPAAIAHVLASEDLDQICAHAGLPALIDDTGRPVTVTTARTYRDADVFTLGSDGVTWPHTDGLKWPHQRRAVGVR